MGEDRQHSYSTESGEIITVTVKELRLRQMFQLLRLAVRSNVDIESIDELKQDKKKLFALFMDDKVGYEALRVILDCQYTDEQLGDMTSGVVTAVVLDFLSCNDGLKPVWSLLLNAMNSLLQAILTAVGPSNRPSNDSSSASAAATSAKKKRS